MSRILDLVGQKFGRLEVVKYAYVKNNHSYFWCKCKCGEKLEASGRLL